MVLGRLIVRYDWINQNFMWKVGEPEGGGLFSLGPLHGLDAHDSKVLLQHLWNSCVDS